MRNTKIFPGSNNNTPCYTKIFGLLFLLCIITASCSSAQVIDMDRNAQIVTDNGSQQTAPSHPSNHTSSASTGDPDGGSGNLPPTASIINISPSTARPGETISFQGYGTDDGTIVGYEWYSNISGFLNGSEHFTNSTLPYGKHLISFYVEDNFGVLSDADTSIVTIDNPPKAYIEEETNFGYMNNAIFFNGSKSRDQDGYIVSWFWSFGDGSTGTGKTITHAYTKQGTYTVTLTVTDNLIIDDTNQTTVTIVGTSPIARAGGPYHGVVNQTVQLNGSKSSDLDGTIVSWNWDFGDGTKGTGRTTQHVYHQKGIYTVTLKVTDNQGYTGSDITTAYITELNYPPTQPKLNVTKAGEGNTTMVFSMSSVDPDGDTIYYKVLWGDNITTTTPAFPSGTILSLSHTWKNSGVYTVLVVAFDEHNDSSVPAELMVNVSASSSLRTNGSVDDSSGSLTIHTTPIHIILAMIGGMSLLIIAVFLMRSRKQKRHQNLEQL